MKKIQIILTLLIFISFSALAQKYELTKSSDPDKSFFFYFIKTDQKDIAKLCLIDSDKDFHFFSNQSDSLFFKKNAEKKITALAKDKKIGKPLCVILADFEKTKNSKRFYKGYFWESLGLIFAAPVYFREVNLIKTNKISKRFFLKIEINKKTYYSIMATESPMTIEEVKKIFIQIKELGLNKNIKPIPLTDFPLKLISFNNEKAQTIYASDSVKGNYSCLFMAGK